MNWSDEHSETTLMAGPPSVSSGHVGFALDISGDRIARAAADIGHQHRGVEKIAESLNCFEIARLMGRLDCRSPGPAVTAFCLAVERLAGISVPQRAELIRTAACELWRISEHAFCAARCFAEAGLASPAGRLASLAGVVEAAAAAAFGGAGAFVCIGGLRRDISSGGVDAINRSLSAAKGMLTDALSVADSDGGFVGRTQGLAALSEREALSFGLSGPALRACGTARDARRDSPYLGYGSLDWRIPLGSFGDARDRVMVRLHEATESAGMVEQALGMLTPGPVVSDNARFCLPEKHEVYGAVQGAIRHFRMTVDGMRPPAGEIYFALESAGGELGIYLVFDGIPSPQRLRIVSPSFALCQAAQKMLEGTMLDDLSLALASLNINAQEMDR